MIRSISEKLFKEDQIRKLEYIIIDFKEKLLPERPDQFKDMSAIYVRKIIEMREEIELYTGMYELLIERNDINIHIKGPVIDYGSAPISIISSYLDNFRKAMQRVYSIKHNISVTTRVPNWLAKLTDFKMNAYQPGSINLSLSIPEKQIGFYEDMNITSSIELYFKLLEWISNDKINEDIEKLDEKLLEKLLIIILKTLPDNKNIESIEYQGNSLKDKIYINSNSRKIVKDKISKITHVNQLVNYKGCIRELDLDRLTFVLRNIENSNIKQIRCTVNEENIDDIKNYLDVNVSVTGTKNGTVMIVKYIELTD